MPTGSFDLTPDPNVLIALTHTPLEPMDALCELIDNALDSFQTARLEGDPVSFPLVVIDLPTLAECNRGLGLLRVRDNGPGLTPEHAEKALKAGYSSNNPYDRLGLFGMGFNIATGKLGSVTKFFSRRKGELATEVTVDLQRLQDQHTYKVPFDRVKAPPEFAHGTYVEVRSWWPEGNPNRAFIKKLVAYGQPKIAEEVGRRYATILREQNVRILVNGEQCSPFEHCVWDTTRRVDRQGVGQIPAAFHFNEVINTQKRCTNCSALITDQHSPCPTCKESGFRTLEERIRGWVGIQRFDDPRDFGVDLIRNGRAIRVFEQAAFFEFTDEFKKTVKDYPIDSPYGRIVGEVHLDHVRVDFLKQDFQRSTEEWRRAMTYLRGDSSLQPTQPNAEHNKSYVFRLYQGYRRVRTAGTRDMYMGIYDVDSKKPRRISRDVEREYYAKFTAKLPGYHDDTEWWRLVEQADQAPAPELVQCTNCGADNLVYIEECQVCGYLLISKSCIKCARAIPKSAVSCPHCGASQIPEIVNPWRCNVCGTANEATAEACSTCAHPRGSPSLLSREFLIGYADKDDALSLAGSSILLADGSFSQPINVDVYVTRGPIAPWQGRPLPLLPFKSESIEIFVDRGHALFRSYQLKPEFLISTEVASYIYETNRRLTSYAGIHTLSNLGWQIVEKQWGDSLEDSPDKVSDAIASFFDSIRGQLPILAAERSEDLYRDLTESQQHSLVDNLINRGEDPSRLGDMRINGTFLRYVDEDTIVSMFRRDAALFFDGAIWDKSYSRGLDLPDSVLADYQSRIRSTYLNCMEDAAAFLKYRTPELLVVQRARASIELLLRDLT